MQPPLDDHALLREYARSRSEPAFRELVRRHIDFVHAAARRQVRDAHQAEDVTQAVFLLLSQKAHSISSGTIIAGWLYNTTRYASQNARRAEARRKHHEQKAGEAMLQSSTTPPHVNRIEPEMDEAISRLGARDRTAIVLRFFNGLSLREVGESLKISEDAAKVRVSRAVAKLRRLMGAAVPVSGIVAMLSDQSAGAAPSSLAESIVSCACGSSVPPQVLHVMKGAVTAMRYAQLKLTAFVVAFVAATGSVTVGFVALSFAPEARVAPATVLSQVSDRSTPSRAMQTLMKEMLAGRDKGQGWIADTDAERMAGEMISDMYFEAGQVKAEAQKRFGKSVQTPLALQMPAPELLEGASEVYPAGQTEIAYVIDRSGRSLLPMRRAGDEWKLDVADIGFNLKLDAETMAAQCREKFELYKSVKDRVRGGEFETAQELEKVIAAG